jgi:hypothetical protein
VGRELPSEFAVVFDGWTEGTQHYIAVLGAYLKVVDGKEVPTQTILTIKPLLANGVKGMRAVDQIEHIEKVLESYGKKLDNILCLVGDNCSVNKSMSWILDIPLIGWASHKFNLAVWQWIANQPQLSPIFEKVKCNDSNCCFAIHKLTPLVPFSVILGEWGHEEGFNIEDCRAASGADLLCHGSWKCYKVVINLSDDK